MFTAGLRVSSEAFISHFIIVIPTKQKEEERCLNVNLQKRRSKLEGEIL